jgi:hypothetical protein
MFPTTFTIRVMLPALSAQDGSGLSFHSNRPVDQNSPYLQFGHTQKEIIHMNNRPQKLMTGLMILIIGLVGPEILLSQEENRTVVSQSEKKDLTKDIGEQSLDDLKNKRSMVENAGDLGEIEKKTCCKI